LFLFSQKSIERLLRSVGFSAIHFLEPFFPEYDMFVIAARDRLREIPRKEAEDALLSSASGRLVAGLLDLGQENRNLREDYRSLEQEVDLLRVRLEESGLQLEHSEQDRRERLELITALSSQLQSSEADRAERLTIIERLGKQLSGCEEDRTNRLRIIRRLDERLRSFVGQSPGEDSSAAAEAQSEVRSNNAAEEDVRKEDGVEQD